MMINRSNARLDTTKPAAPSAMVYVVDDDPDVRDGLTSLLDSVGLESRAFASTEEFLRNRLDTVSCLVLDVRLPETGGLDFQTRLLRADIHIPVIFVTGFGDIAMS